MKAINIIWDTDNKELPESITIPRSLFYSDIEVISDYITEQTGFCHKGFNLLRTESDCLKLIEDAIKLKLLISKDDKIYVYKEGIMDMVLVGKDEAAYDLYSDQEAQEFFVSKINEVDNKKHLHLNGVIEVPSYITENEFLDKFLEFIEDNYWSFGGGIKEE